MNIEPQSQGLVVRSRFSRSTTVLLTAAFIAATAAAGLCATGNYREAGAVAAMTVGAAFALCLPISLEAVLVAWFAATPLASFYIRFPTDRSILTFNRIVIAVVIMLVLSRWQVGTETAPIGTDHIGRARLSISKFELSWAMLAVLVLASALANSDNVPYAARMAIDTFWLPLLVFHIARNHFDLRHRGKLLIVAAIALALFLFATGAVEFASGTDLFAYKGSEIVREGERRVNGPFASDSSYAIICLLLFLFLFAAPRLFSVRLDRTARLAHRVALVAAALGALMPMFRAVAAALVVGGLVLWFQRRNAGDLARRAPANAVAVLILIVLAAGAATMAPPILPKRLADPRTAYGRLATWKAAAEIVIDNPILGVGLGNYATYFDRVRHEEDEPIEEVLETRASRDPHSNVLWIAAETGVIGLVLYIGANLWLFLIGWRALKRAVSDRQRAAAMCYLVIFAAYQIPGVTLASGYYSDLNLCFFFLLGILSNSFLTD